MERFEVILFAWRLTLPVVGTAVLLRWTRYWRQLFTYFRASADLKRYRQRRASGGSEVLWAAFFAPAGSAELREERERGISSHIAAEASGERGRDVRRAKTS